jgi:hypothetical protein
MSPDDEQERLLRALRAPGSNTELSDEERYRAMFRAADSRTAPAPTRHSRAPSRLLIGGSVAMVLAVGTGGVAAAYAGNLPAPIQTLAHHVIGAPEASPRTPSSESRVPSARTPSSSTGPTGPTGGASRSPSARPTRQPVRQPRRPAPSSGASDSTAASKSATGSRPPIPSSSPSSTGTPAPVLTGVTVVGSSAQADFDARVRFSGQLTYSSTPTSRQRVVLQEQVGSRWRPAGHGRSDADGRIRLTASPLRRTSRFRLVAGQGSGTVHSVPWRVAMHPLITTNVSASKKEATITVTALGGFGGDHITLASRRDGRPLIVSRARLDAAGSASFVVTPDQRRTSYTLVLEPTKRHTSARVGVAVKLARGTQGQ